METNVKDKRSGQQYDKGFVGGSNVAGTSNAGASHGLRPAPDWEGSEAIAEGEGDTA